MMNKEEIAVLSSEMKQKEKLDHAELLCHRDLDSTPTPDYDLYCPGVWDNVMCWNNTPAGTVAYQPCPDYINGFDHGEYATKECMADGKWFTINGSKPWTNYSMCNIGTLQPIPVSPLIQEHMPRVKLMYTIGYSVSLVFLILAVAIMVYFKRLHCARNMIHLNLFLAFLLRAAISLMKGILLVNEVGFPGDVFVNSAGITMFKEGPHWECRMFFTLFHYSIIASVFWIFNEGLFLQLILTVSVFAEKNKIRWFVVFGWGSPVIFIIPWVFVRIYKDNFLCWNIHHYPHYYWIIRGPMVLSVLINFIIFINIVRLLFTKLTSSNCHESRKFRYRRLAKSTLILIPLFAVYYMAFIVLPPDLGDVGSVVRMYIELVFNSFQGFFVAMLFCFCNQEVQAEIQKKWKRQLIWRASSFTGGRSVGSMNHRSVRALELSPKTHTKSIMDSIDEHRPQAQHNGHLTSISEEHIPLSDTDHVKMTTMRQDCNDNQTGSRLPNGDSHAQNEPMIKDDGVS